MPCWADGFDRPNLQNFQAAIAREARIGKAGTRNIVLESGVRPSGFPAHGTNPSKCVILSSVSSAERLHSPETSQDKDLCTDDNADDIFTADDKTEDIVSHRTTEQQRVSSWADDTDDKNPPSTSSVGVAYR